MFGIKQKCHTWLGLDLRDIKQVPRGGTAISDALIGYLTPEHIYTCVFIYLYL